MDIPATSINSNQYINSSGWLTNFNNFSSSSSRALDPSNLQRIYNSNSVNESSSTITSVDRSVIEYLKGFDRNLGHQENQVRQNEIVSSQTFKNSLQLLNVLASGQASSNSTEKIIKTLAILNKQFGIQISGNPQAPSAINGVPVVASNFDQSGEPGFLLADGSVVSQSQTLNSYNISAALNAVNILASNANTEDKIFGLTGLGVNAAHANDLISDSMANGLGSALQLYGTISNWDEMNDAQRVGSGLQSAQMVAGSLDDLGITSISSNAGASTLGTTLGGAASAAGIITGTMQAIDVFEALGDMPRSEGQKAGAIGLGTAGAAIGAGVATLGVATGAVAGASMGSAVPVVGTIIGAAVGALVGFAAGSFGSSKSAAQMLRDKWRDALEKTGFAQKVNGSHHVPLADGSTYNIGVDGKNKLTNLDGTQRYTFDVDWSNPIAAEAIPEAHLLTIASGLDPSVNQKGLWTTAVSQMVNAATSNAETSEDASNNFRAMLASAQMNPVQLGLRIEMLRAESKINEQEYLVYLNKLNSLYGIGLAPTDREESKQRILEQLTSSPESIEANKELIQRLM